MNFCVGMPFHMFVRDARQGKPETIATVVREVEDMGFWALTVSHHISDPGLSTMGHAGGELVNWRYGDPISMLSYLAAVSRTAKLLSWVMILPYRNPVELAHSLATIDSLSGGRLVLGAGVGSRESEFQLLGVPRNERGKMGDEWLDIIIELWANPQATYSGRYYSFENVNLTVRPVQQPRPPIWIGGGTGAALRRAIRVGDVWAPTAFSFPSEDGDPRPMVTGSPLRGPVTADVIKEELAWANEQRKALGKPPLECAAGAGIPLTFLDKPQKGSPRSRKDVTHFTSRGTPDELLEEFAAFKEAGVTNFSVKFTGDTPEDYLRDAETFATRIMPALG